ncbi:MAG: TRAP transporter small permease [Gammaproteobacteria bacterium]|nr:TRAP transporter small permease [Gammaproteobacteria bacterium]
MTDTPQKVWRRVGNALALAPALLGAAVLFVLMAMTFFDVILRSLFNDPIEAATELTRLFMAIMVFSALPLVSWHGEHIVVDLFDGLFNATAARIRDAAVNLISGMLLLWPALRVWQLAARAREYGDVTEYLHIPQFYIAYFIAIMTLATAVALCARGAAFIFAPSFVAARSGAELHAE